MKKVVLDTNVYVDWLNHGHRPELMLGAGLVRYLSAVVLMELRIGATRDSARRDLDRLRRAYEVGRRLIAPSLELFDRAGVVLQRLRASGREIRKRSENRSAASSLRDDPSPCSARR